VSVSNQETEFQYVGNGLTVQQLNDLYISVDNIPIVSGIIVNGIGSLSGGSVTFSSPPASGAIIRIERIITLERTTDYQQNGDFLARVVNPDFDRLWMALQQIRNSEARSLRFPRVDINPLTELPPAASRANNILSFDNLGNPIVVIPQEGSAAGVYAAVFNTLGQEAGSNYVFFKQSGTGAGARSLQSKDRDIVNIRDFSAVDGGDIYAALVFAVAEMTTRGGGDIHVPESPVAWKLSGVININHDDIRIVGAGHGGNHDVGSGTVAATQIDWIGASNGDMFVFEPPAGAVERMQGNGITGVYLNGASGAGRGVVWNSVCNGEIDIAGGEFGVAMLDLNVKAGLSEAADTQHNIISIYGRQIVRSGNLMRIDGITNANVSFNIFKMIVGQYKEGIGVWQASSDNNVFHSVHLTRAGGSVANPVGWLMDASSFVVSCSTNIYFDFSPGAGGVYAAGTERGPTPSNYNHIYYYDKGNGLPDPAIGTGAILFWASNGAPIGKQSHVKSTGGTTPTWWRENDARYVFKGKTVVIAGNSTVRVMMPAQFIVGPDSVQVTPLGSSVLFHAQWGGVGAAAGLDITNDTAAATQFWYAVEGY